MNHTNLRTGLTTKISQSQCICHGTNCYLTEISFPLAQESINRSIYLFLTLIWIIQCGRDSSRQNWDTSVSFYLALFYQWKIRDSWFSFSKKSKIASKIIDWGFEIMIIFVLHAEEGLFINFHVIYFW